MHGWVCQRCGRTPEDEIQLHCAHIITRHAIATRTLEDNAFCLCASCHWYFGKWPIEFAKFTFAQIGEQAYEVLLTKAEEGKGKRVDWDAEVTRLQQKLDSYDED